MKHALAIALLLLLVFAPATSCKALGQAADSSTELATDGWIPLVAAGVGAIFGPIGAVIGGCLGGAYAVSRQRLYSALDLNEAYRKGEIYGRQQTRDMVDAARGARLERSPPAEGVPAVPWYRSFLAIVVYIVLGTLTFARIQFVPRVILGPNRLRALGRIYIGPLVALPARA